MEGEKKKNETEKNIFNNNGWVPIQMNGRDQNTYYWTPRRIHQQAKFYPGISYISCTTLNKIVEESRGKQSTIIIVDVSLETTQELRKIFK